ncbi:DUF4381 domain-containing protein [Persicobacter sp. CCB-QB2]|uniref:DUF4381 domain-containing protein n=1 Tax=Persicobacter sp. CCB-QB2 TaxID=1561025 RepID=UPI0009E249D3|nr:DUF4381 domain-containing protein [Persicobacter sp. CCB-QB2]
MSVSQTEIEIGHLIKPEAVQQDFSTPGWLVLFGAMGLLALWLIIRMVRRYWKNRYRREALQALGHIESRFRQGGNGPEAIQNTNRLLKQVAITAYGRGLVAPLFGPEWLSFLNQKMSNQVFPEQETLSLFNFHIYQKEVSSQTKPLVAAFIQQSKKWIHGHEL